MLSVITLTFRRNEQLRNLISSVCDSLEYVSGLPSQNKKDNLALSNVELVVVDMDAEDKGARDSLETFINSYRHRPVLKYVQIQTAPGGDKRSTLPLAQARNLGVECSKGRHLAFVDVDCMVSPDFFLSLLEYSKNYVSRSSDDTSAIRMGYPRYLPYVPVDHSFSDCVVDAVIHPGRSKLRNQKDLRWQDFWSLCFFMSRQAFAKIGGFDEGFSGYGGEDTDFAKRANAAGMRFDMRGPEVLHQYHTKMDPPINYLEDIAHNCNYYRQKWNELPMLKWLKAMSSEGYINKDFQTDGITVERLPSKLELAEKVSVNPY